MNRIMLIGKIKSIDDGLIDIVENIKGGTQEFTLNTTNPKLIDYINNYYMVGNDIAVIGSYINGYIEIKEVCRY